MKRKHIIGIIVLVASIFFLSPIAYSTFFPGESPVLDDARLLVQSNIMSATHYVVLGTPYIVDGVEVEPPHVISYSDLFPYFTQLQPGDILFLANERYFSSEFIPGKWKHNIIYLGSYTQVSARFGSNSSYLEHFDNRNDVLIIDSSSFGVNIRPIFNLSNLNDISYLYSFASFRINSSSKDIDLFINHSIAQEGKEYDYDLLTDNDEYLYCSELIYEGLKQVDIIVDIKEPMLIRDVITPNSVASYITQKGMDDDEFIFLFNIEKEDGVLIEREYSYFVSSLES